MKFYFLTSKVFVVLLVVTAIIPQSLYAEDPRFLSTYNSEYGAKLFNEAKYDFAIERFVKALLLDPENKTAKDYLLKISDEMALIANPSAYKISRFIDQLEYYVFLDIRLRSLSSENMRLREFLQKNIIDDPQTKEKVASIEALVKQHASIDPQVSIIGFVSDTAKSKDLDSIINELSRERQNLVKDITFWETQNGQLRVLRRAILQQEILQTVAGNKDKTELKEIKERVLQKDDLLAEQHKNIEYFQSQLSSVREDFNTLQNKFKSTDLKIAELTTKLADMSMEIIEKNKILSEKDALVVSFQKEALEAKEKITLVQRIIQEKDDRIASLEKEMVQIQLAVNAKGENSQPQVTQLKEEVKNFSEQFKMQIEKSRERIISLEIQVVDLNRNYEVMVAEAQAKQAENTILRSALQQKELYVGQYRQAVIFSNQKVSDLVGMVDIYRSKLIETKENLNIKEEELSRLKGQITAGQSTIQPIETNKNSDVTYPNDIDLTFSKVSSD